MARLATLWMWGYQHWNTANSTLDIYLLFENGHKSTQTRCKVCSNLTKCTTTTDFRLTSVVFINLEHLSHPTLLLLFIPWKGKCWLKVRRDFCQNNTVMLTYSRVSSRQDFLLIDYSVFCHPPQPYSALPVFWFWRILPASPFIPDSPFINSCAQSTAVAWSLGKATKLFDVHVFL